MNHKRYIIRLLLSTLVLTGLFWVRSLPAQPLRFEVFSLENGLKVYYQFQPETKLTSAVFHFRGGQSLEKPGRRGLAYLTTRLMAEITDEDRLAQLLASGASLTAGSRPDFSAIQFEGLTGDFESILEIVVAGLKNPLFSGPRIDRVRNALKLEAGQEACRLVDSALVCLRRQIFPEGPYGYSLYGQEPDLKSATRKDISQFYESIMNSGSLSLLIITDLERKALQEILTRHLSWIKNKVPPAGDKFLPLDRPPDQSQAGDCEVYQGPPGASVALGYLFPGELAETYAAAYWLEKIIGQGPGSLLWKLRQESGLAYNLNSRLEILAGRIVFICYLETEKEQAAVSLSRLKEAFSRLGQQGLDPETLASARVLAANSYRRESFDRDSRLGFLALTLAAGLPVDFYNSFLGSLEEKNPDQLNELVRATFLPDRAWEVIIIRD